MYYHRFIVNFRKTAANPLYQLHLLVNIPQDGNDLQTNPQTFSENYIIAHGIIRATKTHNSEDECSAGHE